MTQLATTTTTSKSSTTTSRTITIYATINTTNSTITCAVPSWILVRNKGISYPYHTEITFPSSLLRTSKITATTVWFPRGEISDSLPSRAGGQGLPRSPRPERFETSTTFTSCVHKHQHNVHTHTLKAIRTHAKTYAHMLCLQKLISYRWLVGKEGI